MCRFFLAIFIGTASPVLVATQSGGEGLAYSDELGKAIIESKAEMFREDFLLLYVPLMEVSPDDVLMPDRIQTKADWISGQMALKVIQASFSGEGLIVIGGPRCSINATVAMNTLSVLAGIKEKAPASDFGSLRIGFVSGDFYKSEISDRTAALGIEAYFLPQPTLFDCSEEPNKGLKPTANAPAE